MARIFRQNLWPTDHSILFLLICFYQIFFITAFSVSRIILAEPANDNSVDRHVSILVGGDITVGSRLTPILRRQGLNVLFKTITYEIEAADIALATLNTSISENGEPQYQSLSEAKKKQFFRAIPGLSTAIAQAGWDLISLTTPHLHDFGPLAVEDTIHHLTHSGVKTIGVGLSDHAAQQPAWFNVRKNGQSIGQGTKVAIVTYYHAGAFSQDGQIKVARALYSQMIQRTKDLADQADLLVVMMHWGKALKSEVVSKRQQFFDQALISAGADLILSQRLHTLQGIQIFEGKPIIYSLADLIYATYDKRHSQIVIPKIVFQNRQFNHIELIPLWVGNPKIKYQPKVLEGKQAKSALQKYQKLCQDLQTAVHIESDRGWIHR